MIEMGHGKPARELVLLAHLFEFKNSDNPGFGAMTPRGFIAVKWREGGWGFWIDRLKLADMRVEVYQGERPILLGEFLMGYVMLMRRESAKGRMPQASLYLGQTPYDAQHKEK